MPPNTLHSDNLLYVISARRKLSWRTFKEVYRNLIAASDTCQEGSPFLTAQALDMLGHCDLSFSSGEATLTVSPSLLVRLPVGGLPRALLVGSRAPESLNKFRTIALQHEVDLIVTSHEIEMPLLPLRVVIVANQESFITTFANSLEIQYEPVPPAWHLAERSGTLDEYFARCPERSGELEGWRGSWFDPTTLEFTAIRQRNTTGAWLARHVHPVTQQNQFFWRQEGKWQNVERNWGRYAALREARIQVLNYDPKHFILAVPVRVPLPRILARAICLCSGFSPRVATHIARSSTHSEQPHHLFQWVPHELAEVVATKLGQQLQLTTLIDAHNP